MKAHKTTGLDAVQRKPLTGIMHALNQARKIKPTLNPWRRNPAKRQPPTFT